MDVEIEIGEIIHNLKRAKDYIDYYNDTKARMSLGLTKGLLTATIFKLKLLNKKLQHGKIKSNLNN